MKPATLATLDSFTRAYLITALWSSTDETGEPLDKRFDLRDFSAEAIAQAVRECQAFQTANANTLSAAVDTGKVKCGPDFDATERAGHDFWLTRCGHGAGFWDGDWPEPFAETLSDAARKEGNRDIYEGDDGQLYFTP